MIEVSQDELKQAVESQYGGTATFVESVPVMEQFLGETAFSGSVAIFCLQDSTSGATRAYAWEQDRPDDKKRYATALHIAPIDSPAAAVMAAIVAEARPGK